MRTTIGRILDLGHCPFDGELRIFTTLITRSELSLPLATDELSNGTLAWTLPSIRAWGLKYLHKTMYSGMWKLHLKARTVISLGKEVPGEATKFEDYTDKRIADILLLLITTLEVLPILHPLALLLPGPFYIRTHCWHSAAWLQLSQAKRVRDSVFERADNTCK